MDARGIRNNNPGNIRYRIQDKWIGLDNPPVDDKGFCRFSSPVFGIRVLIKTLMKYRTKYDRTTIRQIIEKYAPPTENDTQAYIQKVSKATYSPDMVMNDVQFAIVLPSLVKAIILHETGQQPFSDEVINSALSAAR